ncbi:MAG: 6-phosphogluconolactonase [Herpetosiphon sp.]
MNGQLEVVADAGTLAHRAAEFIAQRAAHANERFTLVLSGGSTPRAVYQLLAQAPFMNEIPWGKLQLFWGDERCVPPDDADSNYRMAREALLDHVPLTPAQIHRMAGERPPSEAAAAYEQDLRLLFGGDLLPRFDLVLLGLGEDGHTASLFPGTAALHETNHWVVANEVPQLHTERLTMSFPVLNNAKDVVFLVSGPGKRAVLQRIFAPVAGQELLPSQRIQPTHGALHWLLDQAAAPELVR